MITDCCTAVLHSSVQNTKVEDHRTISDHTTPFFQEIAAQCFVQKTAIPRFEQKWIYKIMKTFLLQKYGFVPNLQAAGILRACCTIVPHSSVPMYRSRIIPRFRAASNDPTPINNSKLPLRLFSIPGLSWGSQVSVFRF